MNALTIIYSSNSNNLFQFQEKSTHWLPELSDEPLTIYQPPNVICTTKLTSLDLIKELIITGTIHHSKVIWINASDKDDIIAYTFDSSGEVNNFFKL